MLLKNKIAKSPSKIFLILVILIFVLAISLTSMETRHLGNFSHSFLILATLFDHEIKSNSRILKITNFFILSMIISVHLLWVALKML